MFMLIIHLSRCIIGKSSFPQMSKPLEECNYRANIKKIKEVDWKFTIDKEKPMLLHMFSMCSQ